VGSKDSRSEAYRRYHADRAIKELDQETDGVLRFRTT
jgi:hypothetical protein